MCGIFGIDGCEDAANLTYLGLYALQHRGQESAGIVSWDGAQLHLERGMGHVSDIFTEQVIARLPGSRALGHTRYSTAGSSVIANAQPIVVKTSMGPCGIIHNGNLVNPKGIRERLELEGSIFQTTSDTEVILHLMARNPRPDLVESLMVALEEVRGAYSLLLITDQCLIAARDPNGFRPLVMGDLDGCACFASESCAFDLLGARFVRELAPGDVVVPVPDSGLYAAMGYSRESGLPMEFGLTRNHYVGRTFIEPKQSIRNFGVKIKLNPVRELLTGRRVVLVDDSIVRGT